MRRTCSGGGKPLSNNDRILRRHIEAAGINYSASTVEDLVDNLRSCYPNYARRKLRPFTKQVERVIMVSSRRNDAMDESDADDGDTPILKKRRKIDDRDEKLQLIEAEHGRHQNGDVPGSGGGGSSSSSLASAMMQPKELGEERAAREAVELEVVDSNKVVKEVNLMNGEPKLCGNLNKNDCSNNVVNRPMFKDLGGMRGVMEDLEMDVLLPLYHPQLLRHLVVKPVVGILLHGPPGCGKTRLAHAIANETGVPFYKVSATELVSGVSGESEKSIRELFSQASRTAPSIVFIDEIDAIASKRDNLQREMEKRIVTQLMTCMDPVDGKEGSDRRRGYVLVIGATNRPDALDPAVRRTGRFDREIALGVPDEAARVEILSAVTRNLKVKGALDLMKIARSTPGFVGADLSALAKKAAILAIKRTVDKRKIEYSKEQKGGDHNKDWLRQPWSDEEMESLFITMADFEEASKVVQPSLRREGFSIIPNVKWDDVGGLHLLREEFDHYIVGRIKGPKDYEDFGLDVDTGFLLYGPPGCGKTLIAKAVANEAGANFIHIKGPELLNKYVGESESAVRAIFSRARACSPCIIFFDEVDALTTERGNEGGWVVERLLNQLLIELDGAEERRGVYVIGATNRPEVMDPALLRPGRFGQLMYVPLPSPDERGMILKALCRKKPIDANVDLVALGKDERLNNFSGADLSYLVVEAARAALRDKLSSSDTSSSVPWTIKDAHFTRALTKVSPSVSDKQRQYYKHLSESLRA